MQNEIRWNRGNEITLKNAVRTFNKKITELNKLEEKSYLPDMLDYKDLKDKIKTENELKRLVKDLRSFSKKENQQLYRLESGEEITFWEYKSIQKNVKKIKNRLIREKIDLETPEKGQKISRAQMRHSRYFEVMAELNRLEKFEKTKTGSSFKSFLTHLRNAGTQDYAFKKAIVYKENYMNTINQFSNLDGYEQLLKKFKSLSNPIDFFNFIEKSGNINIIDLHYVSDATMTQSQFYNYLEDLGIELNENELQD